MRTFNHLLGFLLIASITFQTTGCSNNSGKPAKETIAYQQKDSTWTEFRKDFKYHMQTIGVTQIYPDKSIALVISEPPPHVTVGDIKEKLRKYNSFVEERTNKIGY